MLLLGSGGPQKDARRKKKHTCSARPESSIYKDLTRDRTNDNSFATYGRYLATLNKFISYTLMVYPILSTIKKQTLVSKHLPALQNCSHLVPSLYACVRLYCAMYVCTTSYRYYRHVTGIGNGTILHQLPRTVRVYVRNRAHSQITPVNAHSISL